MTRGRKSRHLTSCRDRHCRRLQWPVGLSLYGMLQYHAPKANDFGERNTYVILRLSKSSLAEGNNDNAPSSARWQHRYLVAWHFLTFELEARV